MTLPEPTATWTTPSKRAQHQQARTSERHTATGTTVAQLPEPVPEPEHTNRSQHDHYEPGQHSTRTAQHGSGTHGSGMSSGTEVARYGTTTDFRICARRAYPSLSWFSRERVTGIEPAFSAWEARSSWERTARSERIPPAQSHKREPTRLSCVAPCCPLDALVLGTL